MEHSIEEVLGLSLQSADADSRALLLQVLTLRQHLAASAVLHTVLLKTDTGRMFMAEPDLDLFTDMIFQVGSLVIVKGRNKLYSNSCQLLHNALISERRWS